MGVDQPDEADEPPDEHADHRDDQGGDDRAPRPPGAEPETRDREEYYVHLRREVSAEGSATAQRITAEE